VIGQNRPLQSKANDWAAEISLQARVHDRMPKDEVMALAKSAFAIGYQQAELAHRQTRVEHSRHCIRLGHGDRRITAFLFDPPYPFIEIHSEPGIGALTASEADALGLWLRQRVSEMRPAKPRGWLRRLLMKRNRSPAQTRVLWHYAYESFPQRLDV
jgi:hypothetical protein